MIAGKKAETKDLKMIDHFSVHVLYGEVPLSHPGSGRNDGGISNCPVGS